MEDIINNIEFSDIFRVAELQQLQDLFSNATGVASIITKPDGTPITKPSNFCRFCNEVVRGTEKGLRNCMRSDTEMCKIYPSGPRIQTCFSGGLWGAGVSIVIGGNHIASWLIGQVRNDDLDESKIEAYADTIGVDRNEYKSAFIEVPVMSTTKFKEVAYLLYSIANSISERAYRNKKLELLILEQKKIEYQLKQSEEKYRNLVENSMIGVVQIGSDWKLSFANNTALKMFEADSINEVISRGIAKYFKFPIEKSYLMRLLKEHGHVENYELTIITSRENERNLLISLILIQDQVDGTFTDITERKLAEKEIKLKNEQLNASNAEKDKFFSIIAHDLRSPFNSFLGLTHIMSEDLHNMTLDQIQKIAASMKKSAGNVNSLLENLLNWSRTKRGLIPFEPDYHLVHKLLEHCTDSCTETAHNKSIDIEFDFPENLEVYADLDMLQAILRNIVSNSLKFSSPGGKVLVSAKKEDTDIIFTVRDNGIGMSKRIRENLFHIDVNTTRKGTAGEPSTGLGLLLCKEFADKHGGIIWVESTEGKGSTFYISFPDKIN